MPTSTDRLVDAMLAEREPQPPPAADDGGWLRRELAAAGGLALGVLPVTRLGRAMFATTPRMLATLGVGGAAGALAADPAEAQGQPTSPPPGGSTAAPPLVAERHPNQDRIDRLDRAIQTDERAIERLGQRERNADRLWALSQPIQKRLDSNRDERRTLQAEVTAAAAERRRQEGVQREEERLRNRTWRERNPDLAAMWPALVPLAAAGAGALTRGGERITRYLGNRPWHRDVARAERSLATGDPMAATHLKNLQNRNAAYTGGNAGHESKLPSMVGAGVGLELGLYPMQSDIMNLGFSRAVENPWELAKAGITAGAGAFTGHTAGKLAGAFIPRSEPPLARSQALASQLTPQFERTARQRLLESMRNPRGGQPPPGTPPIPPTPSNPTPTPPTPPPGTPPPQTPPTPPTPPPTPPVVPPTPPPKPPQGRRSGTRQPATPEQKAERQLLDQLRDQLSSRERLAESMFARKLRLSTQERIAILQHSRGGGA